MWENGPMQREGGREAASNHIPIRGPSSSKFVSHKTHILFRMQQQVIRKFLQKLTNCRPLCKTKVGCSNQLVIREGGFIAEPEWVNDVKGKHGCL